MKEFLRSNSQLRQAERQARGLYAAVCAALHRPKTASHDSVLWKINHTFTVIVMMSCGEIYGTNIICGTICKKKQKTHLN